MKYVINILLIILNAVLMGAVGIYYVICNPGLDLGAYFSLILLLGFACCLFLYPVLNILIATVNMIVKKIDFIFYPEILFLALGIIALPLTWFVNMFFGAEGAIMHFDIANYAGFGFMALRFIADLIIFIVTKCKKGKKRIL